MIIHSFTGFLYDYSTFRTINVLFSILKFFIIVIFLAKPNYLNRDKLYKYLKLIGIITTLFIFFQFFMYYFNNKPILGYIPGLKLTDMDYLEVPSITYGRPNSLFFEPAHYSIYILPIYTLSLIKREYYLSSFLLIGLFVSTSGTGIFIGIIITLLYTFNNKNWKIFSSIIIVTILLIFILPDNFFDRFIGTKLTLSRFFEDIRLLKPLEYFEKFDITNWFFGLGLNNLSLFMESKGINDVPNYANVMIYSFISFGIIGGGIIYYYIIFLYKKIIKKYKLLWVTFLFILFTDQLLFNRSLIYLLIITNTFLRSENNENSDDIRDKTRSYKNGTIIQKN